MDIDRDDIPAGLVEPGEIADFQRWADYWNSLSAEGRVAELQMMDDYASWQDGT